MNQKKEISISSDALLMLACFTVRETLRTLQAKDLLTDTELQDVLNRAVDGLSRSTIGLTKADVDTLLNVLMDRPFVSPERNLN